MRPGANPRRNRGRNQNGGGHGGGHGGHGGGGQHGGQNRRPAGPQRHQNFESNCNDHRIRGTAFQVHEKYLALARDAATSGDRVAAENYLQHAEHYHRIILQIQEQEASRQMPNQGRHGGNGSMRNDNGYDDDGADDGQDADAEAGEPQPVGA
ncbi:MAG TPA: DUF4167 domain-containing protein [Alphaproteobacteria bacterium]|nr:DUF4167 domain-containing protein [Alphaproteobacteria bacterium]